MREVLELYQVGGKPDGRVIFWQIDEKGRVRSGKVMKYRANGHRAKKTDGTLEYGALTWEHAILKKAGKLPDDWQLEQCAFGAHLAPEAVKENKPVIVVESEKNAIAGACAFPQFVWISVGGKDFLKRSLLLPFKGCKIQAIPDLGATEKWRELVGRLQDEFNIFVSDILEKRATPKAIEGRMDIADYLAGEF